MKTEYVCVQGLPGTDVLARIAAIVEADGIVAFATDTVYGVGCRAFSSRAESRLRAAKEREADKPLPILAESLERVVACGVRIDGQARRLLERFWPGPLTVVLELQGSSPAGQQTEGFRVPDCPVARAVLGAAGGVMRVTSANMSGAPPACSGKETLEALDGRVDLVLDTGLVPGGTASTVIRVNSAGYSLLRPGPVSVAELAAAFESK